MRIDRNGQLLAQTTIWIPASLLELVRADRLNLSEFNIQQLTEYYGLEPTKDDRRDQIAEAAEIGIARQHQILQEREANRARALNQAKTLREEREAAHARQAGITEALLQVAGPKPAGRHALARMLPVNDPYGDRADDWDALVRRVGRLCGGEIDSAEVATALTSLAAAKA